jgi:uncharacterized membrane protein HdeD (DUF308 family)
MSYANPNITDLQRTVADALHAHWKLFLLQGSVMVILGVLAVAAPAVATFAVDVFFGWLLLFSGVFGLVVMFSSNSMSAFFWTLGTALLSTAAGALLIWQPIEGAISLTILLTIFFIIEGLIQIASSIGYRDVIRNWGWMLASGIADLALAAIIIIGWPVSASWVLGLLVGVNLMTTGVAVISAAVAGRNATT